MSAADNPWKPCCVHKFQNSFDCHWVAGFMVIWSKEIQPLSCMFLPSDFVCNCVEIASQTEFCAGFSQFLNCSQFLNRECKNVYIHLNKRLSLLAIIFAFRYKENNQEKRSWEIITTKWLLNFISPIIFYQWGYSNNYAQLCPTNVSTPVFPGGMQK